MNPFWTSTRGPTLQQGDLLPDCRVPVLPADFGSTAEATEVPFQVGRLIVVTQSCDLANMKAGLVALCPAYTIPEFEGANPHFAK
jgi:hypothetical protein